MNQHKYLILTMTYLVEVNYRIGNSKCWHKAIWGVEPDQKIKDLPKDVARTNEFMVTLKPFDRKDALEQLGQNEYLGIRMDYTMYALLGSSNNPWLSNQGDNIHLYGPDNVDQIPYPTFIPSFEHHSIK